MLSRKIERVQPFKQISTDILFWTTRRLPPPFDKKSYIHRCYRAIEHSFP